MNTFFSKLKKEAQHIRLTKDEREGVRSALEDAMRTSAPQPAKKTETKESTPVKSPIKITPSPLLMFMPRLMAPLAFVLILAVVGGSTAYAAEGALPGDLLYPVKIGVNERVVVALATSLEAKAETHTRLAERRMEEAEALTVRDVLTEDIKENIERRFERHAQAVEEVAALVEEADVIAAAQISARLESSIEAHSQVLVLLSGRGENETSREESSRFARTLRDRGTRFAAAPRATMTLAMKAESDASRDSDGVETATMSSIAQTEESVAVPTAEMSSLGTTIRFAQNASTTLRDVEARFLRLEARLNEVARDRTSAQIENLRERIRTFLENKDPIGEGEAQRAFKDAVRLKTFLDAQEKFRDKTILPVPDDEVVESVEQEETDAGETDETEENIDTTQRDEVVDEIIEIDATTSLDRALPL